MADGSGQFADDISALWGDRNESALVPPRPETPLEPNRTNGSPPAVVGGAIDDSVARLARALATHQADAVSRAELERMRTEIEGAFTHQLAVALYDLLGASNDRFGRTEQRLDDVGRGLNAQLQALRDQLGQRLGRPLEQLERIDGAIAAGSEKLDDLAARIITVQDDVAALRSSVDELQRSLAGTRRRRRRLGRSG